MDINYQKIYDQLSNLFYNTTASDDLVKTKELVNLKKIVDRPWLRFEESKDEFGIAAAHYIYSPFDYLLASLTPTKGVYPAHMTSITKSRDHILQKT